MVRNAVSTFKSLSFLALAALVMNSSFAISAPNTDWEAKARADIEAQKTMTKEERRAHAKAFLADHSKEERRAYNQAYKKVVSESQPAALRHTGAKSRKLAKPVQAKNRTARVPGTTIVYDDGIVTNVPTIASVTYGNRFNPAETSGSVTALTFFMTNVAGSAAFVSVFDQLAGTSANLLTSVSAPGLSTGTFNTFTFASPIAYSGGTFLAGVWHNLASSADSVGLGTGTVSGLGHNGFVMNDIVATGYTPLTTLNALVRASGNVALPVELLEFTVQQD